MPDTKLILIEGLPGAGKSSTTRFLQDELRQRGFACRGYLEEDKPHPIDCLDFEIMGLPEKVIPLWEKFAQEAQSEATITILESRLWQSTCLYMYMSNVDEEGITHFSHRVYELLRPLAPVLIHLDHQDTEAALRRLYTLRGKGWVDATLEETLPYAWFQSRGYNDFAGWVRFFEAWGRVAERLYNDWQYRKINVMNPHDDWAQAYRRINSFLRFD